MPATDNLSSVNPPRETALARRAFIDYCHLGLHRSLEALRERYDSIAAAAHHGYTARPPTTSLNTLKRWSTAHGWHRRAEAWDIERDAEIIAEIKRERAQNKRGRLDVLGLIHQKLAEKLAAASAPGAPPLSVRDWQIVAAIGKLVIEQYRIEYDDDPALKVKVEGRIGGVALVTAADIQGMTLDEIAEYWRTLRAGG